jgi:tetratricopeptide (TPR) repeat protein
MNNSCIFLSIFLFIFNIILIDNSIAQSSVTLAGDPSPKIASSEGKEIKILGIDSTAFPKIKVTLFIDEFCAIAGNLKKENFRVEEDDVENSIENFYFSGNASGQELDLAIVFDETTSMEAEINSLKSKVKDLTQEINSSKFDARYSLVTFNGSDIITEIGWTNEANIFKNVIGLLSISGGNSQLPENSLDAIEKVLSSGFRPDAQKVVIVVTDEPALQKGDGISNSPFTMEDVKRDLLKSGAILFAVSPDFYDFKVDLDIPRSDLSKYADLKDLTNQSNSLWVDIESSDFSAIIDQIRGMLTGAYVIEYASIDATSSKNRNVSISVEQPECISGSASGSYIRLQSAVELTNTGNSLIRQNKNYDALQAFEKAIQLDPNYTNAWDGKGWSMYRQNNYEEALEAFEKAIQLDPNYTNAWDGKGWSLYKLGKYEEALQPFERAIQLYSNHTGSWDGKGWTLYRLNKYDEAIQAFEKAIEIEVGYKDAWSGKIVALYKQGKLYEAAQATDEAKQLGIEIGS